MNKKMVVSAVLALSILSGGSVLASANATPPKLKDTRQINTAVAVAPRGIPTLAAVKAVANVATKAGSAVASAATKATSYVTSAATAGYKSATTAYQQISAIDRQAVTDAATDALFGIINYSNKTKDSEIDVVFD
ncbi:hypothetical protein [Paenibacillus kobensis]|uniref:hypothetical protein n=1 Tax=Paenibacillus kobensis TaxID=59841 RepID=UPI000FD6F708|nr:hypothetical protein [Paenibacillus kobensis]